MNNKHIDDRLLERFLLNELPAEEMTELSRMIAEDKQLIVRLDNLHASNQAILNQYPAEQTVNGIMNNLRVEKLKLEKEHAAKEKTPSKLLVKRLAFVSPVLASLIILFFIISPFKERTINMKDPNPTDITRIKGSELDISKPNLLVYRSIKGQIETLKEGSVASAGDLLQLAYRVPEAYYGVIFSIDGNSMVTLHFPDDVNQMIRLEKKKKVLLKSAYELDDAPDFERFFFITSPQPIDITALIEKAKEVANDKEQVKTGSIQWQRGVNTGPLHQISILISKQ
jgi:hypothetical protein